MSESKETENIISEGEKWEVMAISDCEKYICPDCKHHASASFHPNYIKNNTAGCIRCKNIETVCKRMLDSRNYQFISIKKEKGVYIVNFSCSNDHNCNQSWENLRRGRGCTICNSKRTKAKPKVYKKEKEQCDCKKLRKAIHVGGGHFICEHYNFAIICPE